MVGLILGWEIFVVCFFDLKKDRDGFVYKLKEDWGFMWYLILGERFDVIVVVWYFWFLVLFGINLILLVNVKWLFGVWFERRLVWWNGICFN